MHPQAFLQTYWRLELRSEIFVAMSFSERYESRYNDIFVPAISSIEFNGETLRPIRTDLSKSGESILTEIVDGIAHSQLILADVSTAGKDSITGDTYRNGNVMYEVGLALACRQPSEVLLIKDDQDKFLFDISTIPHITIDFNNSEAATKLLGEALKERLRERNFIHDARVEFTIKSLHKEEIMVLLFLLSSETLSFSFAYHYPEKRIKNLNFSPEEREEFIRQQENDFKNRKQSIYYELMKGDTITSLLEKQLVSLESFRYNNLDELLDSDPKYQLTPLGEIVAKKIEHQFYTD